ncbi:MAG: acetolactate synthase large subunit [bacterium]|nr:acetolactate synthase large subunit [bacterium]
MSSSKTVTSAKLFIQCLEAEGVKYIFGVPGEENLALLDEIRQSSIQFIVTHHEQGAVFMAATMGRLTGKVGVALSTLGPGATNLVTGVAYAQLGGMPLLVITGQKPIKKSKQGQFQIIDIVRLMEPITKMAKTIVSGDRIPSIVREAVRQAESERPGAVHIELPEDIAEEDTDTKSIIPIKMRRPVPDEKVLISALRIIENASRPIVLIAAGANRKLIRKQLQMFLENTKIPFVTTQMGKGVIDESSDNYIGTTSLSADDYVHYALSKADVIIVIGHDIFEKPPIALNNDICKVIHINFYPADIDRIYIPTHEIVGDISHTLWYFTEKIKINPLWDFHYFFKARDILRKDIAKFAKSAEFPLRPERIVSDISKVLPREGILTLDNGMYKIWIARNFICKEQNGVLLDNALATMGVGLPSGIATKIIYPNKKVLVISGDGGIMMSIAEIETAVRLKLNLTILILTDSGFGMVRWKQESMNLSPYGLSFNNPDFVRLAKSFGAMGHKVAKADDLALKLKRAFSSKGVHIISCPINYKSANKNLNLIKKVKD